MIIIQHLVKMFERCTGSLLAGQVSNIFTRRTRRESPLYARSPECRAFGTAGCCIKFENQVSQIGMIPMITQSMTVITLIR